ncbi:hypothetical protein BpHYR1_049262 [Brachionus plicatilis]|uniref:Uncharacterized protein n=1 Tax=Brachionus plicatilis TaxID=10195 RepID=A0A3M7R6M4_BRAPC|nr:hypothetical protein BpHYR1_049262 [Brachionus plicatilis]
MDKMVFIACIKFVFRINKIFRKKLKSCRFNSSINFVKDGSLENPLMNSSWLIRPSLLASNFLNISSTLFLAFTLFINIDPIQFNSKDEFYKAIEPLLTKLYESGDIVDRELTDPQIKVRAF